MLNVANLDPEPFDLFVRGRKRTEWRRRMRPDARLEAIEAGEEIVFLEIGSNRALRTTVRRCVRFDYDDGSCCYAIRVCPPTLFTTRQAIRKIQGWHRRDKL